MSGDLIECAGCGQPTRVNAAHCWRCQFPVIETLKQREAGGVPSFAPVVIVAVFALVVLGVVALAQREAAVAEYAVVTAQPTEAAAVIRSTPPARASATPVPTVGPDQHLVVRGESLFSIADDYGLTLAELRHWNGTEYPTILNSPVVRPGWVLAVAGPPLPTPVPTPVPTARPTPDPATAAPPYQPVFRGAVARFFDITGASTRELRLQMIARASEICGAERAAACAGPLWWDFVPTYSQAQGGICTVQSVEVQWELVVHFPRWVNDYGHSANLTAWWKSTADEIAAHEQLHIDTYLAALPELHAGTAGITCSALSGAIQAWVDVVAARQAAIDGG